MNPAAFTLTTYFMEATYLVASILFILALKMMSHPDTARRGMFLAEGGMFAAIVGTLIGDAHRHLGVAHRRPRHRLRSLARGWPCRFP